MEAKETLKSSSSPEKLSIRAGTPNNPRILDKPGKLSIIADNDEKPSSRIKGYKVNIFLLITVAFFPCFQRTGNILRITGSSATSYKAWSTATGGGT